MSEPHDIHPGVPCRVPGCPGPARAAQDVAGRCKGVCEYDDDPHYHQPVTPPPDALREAEKAVDRMESSHEGRGDWQTGYEAACAEFRDVLAALHAQGVVQSPETDRPTGGWLVTDPHIIDPLLSTPVDESRDPVAREPEEGDTR